MVHAILPIQCSSHMYTQHNPPLHAVAHYLYSASILRPVPGMPALRAAWPAHAMGLAAPLLVLCCCTCVISPDLFSTRSSGLKGPASMRFLISVATET